MKVHELAKQLDLSTPAVLEILGDRERSHMTNVTDEETDKVVSFVANAQANMTENVEESTTDVLDLPAPPVTATVGSPSYFELMEAVALAKITIATLTNQLEEVKKQRDATPAESVRATVANMSIAKRNAAIKAKLATEKVGPEMISKIMHSITVSGTKSPYYEKYCK